MMFAGWGRRSIPGHYIHKKMDTDLAKIVEDDSADPGNYSDTDKIKGPYAGPRHPGGDILAQNFMELLLDLFQG
jgi:hypothetical protein